MTIQELRASYLEASRKGVKAEHWFYDEAGKLIDRIEELEKELKSLRMERKGKA